ncbi:Polyadenylate-binding protein rbp45, variant 2 [Dionaea muscipula]
MMQPGMIPPPIPQMTIDQHQHQQHQPPQQQTPLPPQQYGQPPPQQPWMMMPPQLQPQQQHLQQMWPPQQMQQQQPPPQMAVPPPVQQQAPGQPQQYPATLPVATNPDEIRSLWIGDLQYWMDENYLWTCFAQAGEVVSVKVIRNKHTAQPEGYGFIEFVSRAAAERVLLSYNGQVMPNSEQTFRLNWATLGAGQKKQDEYPDYTIFVGDLAADVTDYVLQETFRAHYPSVKGAKVITDHATGRSKGYGFVRFGDENDQIKAMTYMNGMYCSSRPMRIGPAANKKPLTVQQKAPSPTAPGNPGENDPNNTTIFVGGLDPNVSDDQLKQVFGQFGELVHVKIPLGKRCGFVQFASRACAEQALQSLNGTAIGGQNVRLSWGRSPSNKQTQPEASQWNGGGGGSGYYGYTQQGYDAYGYSGTPQDPNMYYASYPGYANYQQPQQ